MVHAAILLALTILAGVAFLKDNPRVRSGVALIFVMIIVGREFSFGSYARSEIQHKHVAGEWTKGFSGGVLTLVDYCNETGLYVVVVSVFLLLICLRGFRRRG